MLIVKALSGCDSPRLAGINCKLGAALLAGIVLANCSAPMEPPPPPSGQTLPELRAVFAQRPDDIMIALRDGCMEPTQRIVQRDEDYIECRMLLPPNATAAAILRYGGTINQLPELVIRLRLTAVPEGVELGAAQYLEVPRPSGPELRVVYPDPVLDRRLSDVLMSLGGEMSE